MVRENKAVNFSWECPLFKFAYMNHFVCDGMDEYFESREQLVEFARGKCTTPLSWEKCEIAKRVLSGACMLPRKARNCSPALGDCTKCGWNENVYKKRVQEEELSRGKLHIE